jgi:hypothetical protein
VKIILMWIKMSGFQDFVPCLLLLKDKIVPETVFVLLR